MPSTQVSPRKGGALGEIHGNGQDSPRSDNRGRSRSPTKSAFPSLGLKSKGTDGKTPEESPTKPKKMKSGPNLSSLLSKPKSFKNIRKQAANDAALALDKENRAPSNADSPPPIWAQFASDASIAKQTEDRGRPISQGVPSATTSAHTKTHDSAAAVPSRKEGQSRGRSIASAFRSHARSKSVAATPKSGSTQREIEPKDIDKHLEALLDRRNIPENQRYKMRNLADTIKMEFIRQDWAEMEAAKAKVASPKEAAAAADESDAEDDGRSRRGRGRSFTFSRSRKNSASPTKSKRDASIGRHFRSKSTDNIAGVERPLSSAGPASGGSMAGVLSMIKPQQGPSDYVAYLRKVQQPELVEVGKIHKLRLLLRNETVAWIEAFIQQGGMEEIVGLLNRIMEVEWREDHEDTLLHENLLCLKALSTTALAIEYLKNVHTELFPKLLHLIFDPEKKGPSEYTTRNIITSILLTYISSASPAERVIRTKQVLQHLRDPQPKEQEQHHSFLLGMHQERPYRVWCKEAVSVTKEVFWIFLHNANVITLPAEALQAREEDPFDPLYGSANEAYAYMHRHFPRERPPVAAAPYVGGVEWDATNYLASHIDLMNAIIACTATQDARNDIRALLRISGWERCMGGSLRMCKEKFYGCVHESLRTWAIAAAEDGWKVDDVRFGPVVQDISRSHSPIKAKDLSNAPKLEMPRFDLGGEGETAQQKVEAWL